MPKPNCRDCKQAQKIVRVFGGDYNPEGLMEWADGHLTRHDRRRKPKNRAVVERKNG